MFTPVPDKLSVMTYVFQIKTHFSRPPAPPASLPTSHKPRRLPVPPQVTVTSNEEPKGRDDDVRVADTDNRGVRKETAAEGSEEGYNPFLDDEEENNVKPEISTDHSVTSLGDSKQSRSSKQEAVTNSSSRNVESKPPIQESSSKRNDALVKSDIKPPPKPPRLYQTTSDSNDTDSKTSDTVNKKDKSESKPGYNPFDDNETEKVVVSKKTDPSSKSVKPNKVYNPFDDDEGDDVADDDSEEKNLNDNDTKQGYNPFDDGDDDDSEDVTQTNKAVDQKTGKKSSGAIKRQVSYPHSFNPFEDNDDLKSNKIDKSSQRTESKDGKVDKEIESTSTMNPFDDDNDEGVRNDGGATDTSQADSSTRKSSLESKEKVRRASPSGLAKPAVSFQLACPRLSVHRENAIGKTREDWGEKRSFLPLSSVPACFISRSRSFALPH